MKDVIALYEGLLPMAQLEQMFRTDDLFDQFTYTGHTLQLSELMGVKDFENDEKASHTYGIYRSHAEIILGYFGISLNVDDVPTLTDVNDVLEAMINLDDIDNVDIIDQVLNEESENSSWILSGIVSHMSERPRIAISDIIDEVDPALIDKLKIMSSDIELDFEVFQNAQRIRTMYLGLMQDSKSGPVYEQVIKTETLPMYSAPLIKAVMDDIASMSDLEASALELVALQVVIGTDVKNIVVEAKSMREEYLPLGKDAVDIHIEDIFEEHLNAQA